MPLASKAAKTPRARRDMLLFLLLFVGLGAAGTGAYFYLTKSGRDPAQALAGMKEKLERVAEMPGQAIGDAKDGIAGARAGEQDRVNSVLDGKETPDRTGVGSVSPAELEARLKANQAETTPINSVKNEIYSGGIAPSNEVVLEPQMPAPSASAAAPPVASAQLIRYAEGLSVSGVFQGTPARALVNGRLIREGELVDAMIGISFVGVDSVTKHLILEETSGARVRVKY